MSALLLKIARPTTVNDKDKYIVRPCCGARGPRSVFSKRGWVHIPHKVKCRYWRVPLQR